MVVVGEWEETERQRVRKGVWREPRGEIETRIWIEVEDRNARMPKNDEGKYK